MRQFKNNLKRNRNRNHSDRPFKRVQDVDRLNGNFVNNDNFFRRKINRNNGNVQKLITKYNDLAREALSSGDKILSENYFQHADHFTRVLSEQESLRKNKVSENNSKNLKTSSNNEENKVETIVEKENQKSDKIQSEAN